MEPRNGIEQRASAACCPGIILRRQFFRAGINSDAVPGGPKWTSSRNAFAWDLDKQAMEKGIYPYFQALDGMEGTEVSFHGHKIIMIGSNNYLGLTTHPKVKAAAMKALEEFGPSCTGSRFLNGTLKLHIELEERLAAFVGKDSALVFSTGMQTNLGAISLSHWPQ